jgi:hypothetical protein
MGRPFCGKMVSFSTASPKVAQLGRKGGQGLQKDTKMEPQVTKMEPRGPKIRVLWPKKLLERGGSFVLSDN